MFCVEAVCSVMRAGLLFIVVCYCLLLHQNKKHVVFYVDVVIVSVVMLMTKNKCDVIVIGIVVMLLLLS